MNAPAPTQDHVELQATLEQWRRAVCAQDVASIVSHYADEIVAFDAIAQLQFVGKAAYRDHWQVCMENCPLGGPTIFELHQLHVELSGDLALVHGLCRCGGHTADGEEKASWMRMTAGYRKTAAGWRAIHEHFSAPFDMETGAVLFNLAP